jgi:hypothetical protein
MIFCWLLSSKSQIRNVGASKVIFELNLVQCHDNIKISGGKAPHILIMNIR